MVLEQFLGKGYAWRFTIVFSAITHGCNFTGVQAMTHLYHEIHRGVFNISKIILERGNCSSSSPPNSQPWSEDSKVVEAETKCESRLEAYPTTI